MLNNATGFGRIYIACGYTDLCQGIDDLSAVIRRQLGGDPFQKNVLFRLSALNSTSLDVVKVRFIGQQKLYNNGTVKVVPLCIKRKQQANPSRKP